MLVLLTYYFDDTPAAEADKSNFLINLGRLSVKHKFLSEGVVLAQIHAAVMEDFIKNLSADIPSLHLIISLGVRAGMGQVPTLYATPGILDSKDWHC